LVPHLELDPLPYVASRLKKQKDPGTWLHQAKTPACKEIDPMPKISATSLMFDQDQYDMLKRCIEKADYTEWNQWRSANPGRVKLAGADFKSVIFGVAGIFSAINPAIDLSDAYLVKADFEGAILGHADLRGANLEGSNLQGAQLNAVDFRQASFWGANLNGAVLAGVRLNGTSFKESHIEGAKFHFSQVDSETYMVDCSFDHRTDFTGTSLDKVGIDPGLKAALKDNIRRIHWVKWLTKERKKGKHLLPWLVERFWWITDYGSSTKRIFKTFFAFAFGFAGLYWFLALPSLIFPQWQGIIKSLWQGTGLVGCIQTLIRSIYFSIVTMTTLGFGDMHAAENGFWASVLGNIFLSLQVLLGYFLLGALVTRLGIMFISEAPAAMPMTIKKNDNKDG
jgi:hypothetical protein